MRSSFISIKRFSIKTRFFFGRNGANEKSPLIGTYCGTDILPRFKSFSNQMYIRFKTDATRELNGFEIEFDSSSSGAYSTFYYI